MKMVSPYRTDSQSCNSHLLPYYCVSCSGNSKKYDIVQSACVTCGPQIVSELKPLAITISFLGTCPCHSSHNLCLAVSFALLMSYCEYTNYLTRFGKSWPSSEVPSTLIGSTVYIHNIRVCIYIRILHLQSYSKNFT